MENNDNASATNKPVTKSRLETWNECENYSWMMRELEDLRPLLILETANLISRLNQHVRDRYGISGSNPATVDEISDKLTKNHLGATNLARMALDAAFDLAKAYATAVTLGVAGAAATSERLDPHAITMLIDAAVAEYGFIPIMLPSDAVKAKERWEANEKAVLAKILRAVVNPDDPEAPHYDLDDDSFA